MMRRMGLDDRPNTPRERFVRCLPALSAGLFATGWFLYLGYGATLLPTHITWMLRYDWAAALWGFSFFRNADWAFPLGNTPDLFYPLGTSIGFTDACPWMALFFKLLSPILPQDFQYFGLWFWLCYVLQAVVGERITARFTDDPLRRALGGCLFALTPLLPARHAHAALSALFFVTAGVYLHFARVAGPRDARALLVASAGLLAWAAGTHGYLSVMLLALVLALCARLAWVERAITTPLLTVSVVGALGTTLLVYYLFGYVGWKQTDLTAEGFGDFSADLLSLVNPQNWSRFVAAMPYQPRQWEGFGYLGVGVLALLALRLALWIRQPAASARALVRAWPLVVVVLAFAFYALSSRVALRGEPIWTLDGLYRHATKLTGVFRSSGRFIWPLHLVLLSAAVSAACALPRRMLGRALLGLAVFAQAAELDRSPLNFAPVPLDPLGDPAWASAGPHYRHLALMPVHLLWVCRYDPHLVHRLSYEAYRRKWSFNSGNIMRMEPGIRALCERGLAPGTPLDPGTIYVIDPGLRSQFAERGAVCGLLDGLLTCVEDDPRSPLVVALRRQPG